MAGITVASVILGELVPKRIALLNPEGVASVLARPLQLLSWLAYPAVRALALLTDLVLRLLGARGAPERPVSEEEINVLMEQGAEAGVFEKHEQALVSEGVPERRAAHVERDDAARRYRVFRLERCVRQRTRRKLLGSGHSRFVVCKGGLGGVVGIVAARRLFWTTRTKGNHLT